MIDEAALVRAYLPRVKQIAWRVCRTLSANVEHGDCVQAGLVGLLAAIRSRQSERHDNEWGRYADLRVRGAMIDYLRDIHPFGRSADPSWKVVDLDEAADTEADCDVVATVAAREELRQVLAQIEMMPRAERDALLAVRVEGQDAAEYARERGVRLSGLHVTLSTARRRLRKLCERQSALAEPDPEPVEPSWLDQLRDRVAAETRAARAQFGLIG